MKRNLFCFVLALILFGTTAISAAVPVHALHSNETDAGTLTVGTITLSDSDTAKIVYYVYADEIQLTDTTKDAFVAQLESAGYVLPAELSDDIASGLDFFITSEEDFTSMSAESLQSASDISYNMCPNQGSLEACIKYIYPEYVFAEPYALRIDSMFNTGSDVEFSEDGTVGTYTVSAGAAYVDVPINGSVVPIYMVNGLKYIYSFGALQYVGAPSAQSVIGSVVSDSEPDGTLTETTTTTEMTTTTTTTTTTTATTTTTTTTTTTAATTTTTTAATSKPTITTTTTTTTAATTVGGKVEGLELYSTPIMGYVDTRIKPLRLRVGPGFEYNVILVMPRHTAVEIYGKYGDWYLAKDMDGNEGYCYCGYISFGTAE